MLSVIRSLLIWLFVFVVTHLLLANDSHHGHRKRASVFYVQWMFLLAPVDMHEIVSNSQQGFREVTAIQSVLVLVLDNK